MAAEEGGEIPPNATVYVRNLDERVKLPALRETLLELFDSFGTVLDIILKKNVKSRGQAFVIFDDVDSAQAAIDDMQGFEVFGKQMRLEFAKTRSDITVEREDGEEGLVAHKRRRIAEKERKQALEAAQKPANKRPAAEALAERPAKATKPARAGGAPATGDVPDEYLPPNKTLFLRELPDDYGAEGLTTIFSRFPGFREVRMVPGRKGIAFVEYESEEGAITAKESTAGMTLGEKTIRVTFQKGG